MVWDPLATDPTPAETEVGRWAWFLDDPAVTMALFGN